MANPYVQPQQPMPPKGGGAGTIVLIVLGVVVAVIVVVGILAVLAIAGVHKYIAAAKTAEATSNLGLMAVDAASAYTRDKTLDGARTVSCLCGKASAPVPTTVPASRKYASSPADWTTGDALNGWTCLSFTVDAPQYYQYDYSSDGDCSAGVAGTTFSAEAHGDLDGDGTTSSFVLDGTVVGGSVVVAPMPKETNPQE